MLNRKEFFKLLDKSHESFYYCDNIMCYQCRYNGNNNKILKSNCNRSWGAKEVNKYLLQKEKEYKVDLILR